MVKKTPENIFVSKYHLT